MSETIIQLDNLQKGEVIVEGDQGRRFRLQPSFRVGEFQLYQLPAETEAQPSQTAATQETNSLVIDEGICGAPTTKGTPCKRKPVDGSKRCKTHEGVVLDGEEAQP